MAIQSTSTALYDLVGDSAQWALSDEDYSTLEWFEDYDPPTEQEVSDRLAELIAAEPLRELNLEITRRKWAASQYILMEYVIQGQIIDPAWLSYITSLEALSATATPELDMEGIGELKLDSVTWPEPPSPLTIPAPF